MTDKVNPRSGPGPERGSEEDAALAAVLDRIEAEPVLRWPRPWKAEFWTVDTVYASIGVSLSILSTILIVYLSAGYDRQVHDLVSEQRHLNGVFRSGGRALFDMAATAALERTFETHLENVAEPEQRRRETGIALALALRSFKTYLGILAPDAVAPFAAQSDDWLKQYAAGDDTIPATIRTSVMRYINGPVADGNLARAERRAALKTEIATIRNERDFWRATGAFFQIFGIILALCGQVAGRRARIRQFAPPDLKARYSTGPFSRQFWTLDVIAVVSGTLVTLGGTIALYFIVVSYYHVIDEIRGRLELRSAQIELTEAAMHAYDDMGTMEAWVADLMAHRPATAFDPPLGDPAVMGDTTLNETLPRGYIRSRRSFPIFWLARVSQDDDPEKYGPLIDEYYELYEDLAGDKYAAFAARIHEAAAAKLTEIRAERVQLAEQLNGLEGRQALVRDIGGIMQLLGLVFAFAGYVSYYKRPR